jgi:hypothetical protein
MDDLDRRASVLPAQQADAAAFGAKIDGDEGACVGRNKGLVGRGCHLTSMEMTGFSRIHHSTRENHAQSAGMELGVTFSA